MTISAEDWKKLENECSDRRSSLMTADERRAFLKLHAPELWLKAQHRTVRAAQRPKARTISLEFEETEDFYTNADRALEDLVLECVDAGINLDDYL